MNERVGAATGGPRRTSLRRATVERPRATVRRRRATAARLGDGAARYLAAVSRRPRVGRHLAPSRLARFTHAGT